MEFLIGVDSKRELEGSVEKRIRRAGQEAMMPRTNGIERR